MKYHAKVSIRRQDGSHERMATFICDARDERQVYRSVEAFLRRQDVIGEQLSCLEAGLLSGGTIVEAIE